MRVTAGQNDCTAEGHEKCVRLSRESR